MDEAIVVGIDIGTTKVCTLVGRVEGEGSLRILGVGIEPSQGIKKGSVVDLAAASQSISRSIEKAQRSSGMEITSALISLAGSHIAAFNSRGVAAIATGVVSEDDISRALDAAQAIAIPHNREVIHVIQRGFTVDEQEGVRLPIGMHGYRLEVEAHIITASATLVENLRQCVENAGVEASSFVLNPLASGEVVLTETERQMGVAVCDIGGGTTDLAVYIDGDVYHTMVLEVGGNHITNDIAHGLSLPFSQAEEVKKQRGHAVEIEVQNEDVFSVRGFGADQPEQVSRKDLAQIIEARVEEIFLLVGQEIKRSGYDGLLPAGMVLTGGTSLLPGIKTLASQVLGMPVRIARPEAMVGLVDQLHSPAYSTSVGLLYWAMLMNELMEPARPRRHRGEAPSWVDYLKTIGKRMLP
ncbi:MAG TPA: cell division protein FtsA [Longilinea sp.]|nr:cell division protein FtsA [Longilinea sp.]